MVFRGWPSYPTLQKSDLSGEADRNLSFREGVKQLIDCVKNSLFVSNKFIYLGLLLTINRF